MNGATARAGVEAEPAGLGALGSVALAPVGQVLRALVRSGYRAELAALLGDGLPEARAETLAAEYREALAAALLRRMASEIWSGALAAYVPVSSTTTAAHLARLVQMGEPGFGVTRADASSATIARRFEWSPSDGLSPKYRQVEPAVDEQAFAWLTACQLGKPWALRDFLMPDQVKKVRWLASGELAPECPPPIDWLDELFIRADWHGEQPAARPAWPWGEYTTPQLEVLAEVAAQLWERWEGRAAEAKVDADVESLLRDGHFGKTLAPGGVKVPPGIAKAIAVLLRPPGMPTGRKGPEDARDFRWRRGDSIPSGWES